MGGLRRCAAALFALGVIGGCSSSGSESGSSTSASTAPSTTVDRCGAATSEAVTVVRTTLTRLDASGSPATSLDEVAALLSAFSGDITSACGPQRGEAFADVLVAGADPTMNLGPAGQAAAEIILSGICQAMTEQGIDLPARGRAACIGTVPATTAYVTLPGPGDNPTEVDSVDYVVRVGDDPNEIAAKAGGLCSGDAIMDANPEIENLVPGQMIKVPESCLALGVTQESLNATTTVPSVLPEDVEFNTYVVEEGDYWFGIVGKTGCTSAELTEANPSVGDLAAGKIIKVPRTCDTR